MLYAYVFIYWQNITAQGEANRTQDISKLHNDKLIGALFITLNQ